MRKITSFILLLILIGCTSRTEEPNYQKADLWTAGIGEYNNYRIPSLIVSPAGTVLAFCEGREGGDSGDINLLLKRSEDIGKTWSKEQIIWDDGSNSCGNPCPVVDEETGRIWLFMTWNDGEDHETKIIQKTSKFARLPFVCYSDDDADGNIRGGPYAYGAHVIISDDHGKTWRKSKPIHPGCNESQLVELADGTLMMNMRSNNDKYCRASAISTDGGEFWSEIKHELQLVESKCQAGILNYGKYKGKNMYLFSNPAVPVGRTHMTMNLKFS